MSKVKAIKSDRIVTPGGIIDGYLYHENGTITEVSSRAVPGVETEDLTGAYVLPGIVDLHTHGAGGHSFYGAPEDVLLACETHLIHGTTTVYPTLSAAPMAKMENAVANIAKAIDSGKAKGRIEGVHMEGPYLSKLQVGAQPKAYITDPDPAEYLPLIERWGSYIKRWSYAPENDPEGAFCKVLSEHGIRPSAGHTDAKYADMVTALKNGCRSVTHLYSCTSTVTRDHGFRSLGVIETAFLLDDLYVELIADGKHLPPELVRMVVKIKGKERVAFVTDSLSLAGTDCREGALSSGSGFIVEDGVCKLPDRSAFAGSIATGNRMLEFAVNEAGFSVVDAAAMLSDTPARLMGLNRGRLEAGYDVDIAAFGPDFSVKAVYVAGERVFA